MPSDTMGRGWADVLGEIPLFAGLSKRHLNKLAALGKTRRYARFTPIVREGDRGDAFFVILDGEALVKPVGKRSVRLKPGDWFGEMALLDGAPRAATVEAQTEVFAMLLGRTAFLKTVQAEPKIALAMMQTLAQRLRSSERSPAA
ncbi:MAG TPA: cyclic nucleotide-binding domain-containing protein [Gaiellales bacterium]|jgi:CRP-like cAMP-binding protein